MPEPGSAVEPPAAAPPRERPLPTGLVLVLGLAALALGFLLGRRLLGPEAPDPAATAALAARPPTAPVVLAGGLPEAAATADDAGLSTGLDWGEQATLGRPAPPLSLPGLDGRPIRLADYLGQPVLLNFFATWCGPCRVEMPHLEAAWARHRDAGLVVLAVDVQELPEKVPPYLAELGLSFPVVLDGDGAVSNRYRVRILPTSYLIDREGRIAREKVGFYANPDELAADLATILPPADPLAAP